MRDLLDDVTEELKSKFCETICFKVTSALTRLMLGRGVTKGSHFQRGSCIPCDYHVTIVCLILRSVAWNGLIYINSWNSHSSFLSQVTSKSHSFFNFSINTLDKISHERLGCTAKGSISKCVPIFLIVHIYKRSLSGIFGQWF